MLTRRHARSALDHPRLVSIPVPRPRRLRLLRWLCAEARDIAPAVFIGAAVAIVWTALRLAWALGGVIGGGW